jgi:hypothetical protein
MPTEEKRQFSRVSIVAKAKLIQGDQFWLGHVVDISFKGVLINSHSPFILKNNKIIMAEILFENHASVKTKVKKAHNNGQHYGFHFLEFDVDGMSHLRNIIRDNLSDDVNVIDVIEGFA